MKQFWRRPVVGRAVSNAAWLTVTRVMGDLLGLVLFVVLSRRFGPAGIGQYAYGVALAGLVYVAVQLGLEDYGIRECARLPRDGRRRLIRQLLGAQVVVGVFVVGGLLGLLLLTESSAATHRIVLLLALQHIAFAIARTLFVPALADQAMTGPAVAELLCRAAAIGGTLLLVQGTGAPLHRALLPYPLGGLALVGVALSSALGRVGAVGPRLRWREAVNLLRAAWPFAAAQAVFLAYARTDVMMMSWIKGDEAAGLYAASLKLTEVVVMPLVFLGIAAYPALSRAGRAGAEEVAGAADALLRVTLTAGAAVTWMLLFVAPVVVPAALGGNFAAAVPLVRVLAVMGLLMAVEGTLVRLLLATDLQVRRVRLQFWATAFNIALNGALIPLYGPPGAAGAWIASSMLASALYLHALPGRVTSLLLRRTLAQFGVLLAGTLCVGALAVWGVGPNQWLIAAASLAAFVTLVLWTGFLSRRRFQGAAAMVWLDRADRVVSDESRPSPSLPS